MTSHDFQHDFQQLIAKAMADRVPLPNIMTCLVMAQHELGYLHSQSIQQMQINQIAKKMAKDTPKIIKPESN